MFADTPHVYKYHCLTTLWLAQPIPPVGDVHSEDKNVPDPSSTKKSSRARTCPYRRRDSITTSGVCLFVDLRIKCKKLLYRVKCNVFFRGGYSCTTSKSTKWKEKCILDLSWNNVCPICRFSRHILLEKCYDFRWWCQGHMYKERKKNQQQNFFFFLWRVVDLKCFRLRVLIWKSNDDFI